MPTGYQQTCRLWHFTYPQDDQVGGSVPSGTVVYDNLSIRIKSEKPSQVLLEQGVDVQPVFSAYIFAGNAVVQENDQIEITAPAYGWFYGKKFRIVGIQRSSNNYWQDRNQIRVSLKRYGESHNNNLQ